MVPCTATRVEGQAAAPGEAVVGEAAGEVVEDMAVGAAAATAEEAEEAGEGTGKKPFRRILWVRMG